VEEQRRLTLAQIREREERIWAASDRGKTTRTIAKAEGISHQMVVKILSRVERRALKHMAGRVEHGKIRRTGQLEQIIEYAFDAYLKSLEPKSRVTEKTSDEGETVKTTEVVEQMGDQRALHTAMAAIDRFLRLWGLEVLPASQEMTDTVSAIVEGIKARAQDAAQKTAAAGDPAGAEAADRGGVGDVPGGPDPVQPHVPGA
jgi:transposase